MPVVAKEMAPQRHLLPDYAYILKISAASYRERIDRIRRYIAWAWLLLVAACVVVFAWDMARGTRASWPIRLILLLAVALFGPLGLLVYYLSYRQPVRSPNPQAVMTNWRRALYATVHSLVGYVAAVVLAVVYFVAFHPGARGPTIAVVSYAAPFVVGLMVFRAPFVAGRVSGRYGLALRRTLLAEIVSLNLVLAITFPVFFFLRFRWFSGDLELATPVLWLMMSISGIAGAAIVYPFNAWICRRGFGSALVQPVTEQEPVDEKPTKTPNLKDIWHVLVLSVILLVVSIGVTVLGAL